MIVYYKGYLTNIGITDTGATTNTREETVNPGKKPLSCIVDTQTSLQRWACLGFIGGQRNSLRLQSFPRGFGRKLFIGGPLLETTTEEPLVVMLVKSAMGTAMSSYKSGLLELRNCRAECSVEAYALRNFAHSTRKSLPRKTHQNLEEKPISYYTVSLVPPMKKALCHRRKTYKVQVYY